MSRNLIQKLRDKPKDTRNAIAMSIAGVFTGMVFIVWLVASTSQFGEVVASSKQGVSAFSTFLGHAKSEVASVKEALPDKAEFEQVLDESNETQATETLPATSSSEAVDDRPIVRISTTSKSTEEETASSSASTY